MHSTYDIGKVLHSNIVYGCGAEAFVPHELQ